jgi:MerR family copper efflux transcriptional regulator
MRFREMKIGEVAKAAGIGIDAVRFYERQGLIPEPPRQPSGYRVYSPDVVLSLRFIRRAKELGFSLKEIAELLSLETAADAAAADVKKLAEAKLADMEERIRALQRMRRALKKAVAGCPGQGPTSGCSILRSLADVK